MCRLFFGIVGGMWMVLALTFGADERVTFRDVAGPAAIDFQHTNGRAGELYVIEVKGAGAAFVDYDNDGDLDVYAVNGSNLPGAKTEVAPINRLYRNDGDGTFTDVTAEAGVGHGGYGHGVACADYDNDGDQDMFVANYGPNVLYRNNGDGTFSDVTAKSGVAGNVWSVSAAFCDLDNDGLLDLYVANYLVFDIDSTVKLPPSPGFYDGEPDVLYLNNGDGTFRDVTRQNIGHPDGKGLGVTCFDYDEDGDLEIYVANDGVANLMYENKGGAVFEDVTLFAGTGVNSAGEPEAGMGVDAGDFDNDGDLDLFVTNYKGETNTLYRNDNGVFADKTRQANLAAASLPYVTFGTVFFDYDNDGDLDLFVANGHTHEDDPDHEQPDQLFENVGGGRYEDVSDRSGPYFASKYVGRGVAAGDYDNDGDVDLIVSNKNAPLALLQNRGGNSRNWLLVRTIGTRSNRDGIGARLKVSAPGFERIKDVKTGYSMLSSNDPRVHFGLGDLERIDLEVRWPSGLVETIRDLPTNKLVVVKEGAGAGLIAELGRIETDYGGATDTADAPTEIDEAEIENRMESLRTALADETTELATYLKLGEAYPLWLARKTRDLYGEILAAQPESYEAWFEYGMFLQNGRELEAAIEAFLAAGTIEPKSSRVYARVAALNLRLGKYERSVVASRRRMELGDKSEGAYLPLGEALQGLGRHEEAEATLTALLQRYPRSVDGLVALGEVYRDRGDAKKAVDTYRKAVRIQPGVKELRYRLAEVYRQDGDDEAYRREMKIFSLLETESVLFKGGMSPEAEIEVISREIRMNPLHGHTRAYRDLTVRYEELGDTRNKELFSLRARASDLKDQMATQVNGYWIASRLNAAPDASERFKEANTFRQRVVEALNRASGFDSAKAEALVSAAQEAHEAGEYDEALVGFKNALLQDPDNIAAYHGLARVHLSGNFRLDYARRAAQHAVRLGRRADSYALLAEIHRRSGDRAAAEQARDATAFLGGAP